MERRFNRNLSNEKNRSAVNLQKKIVESRRTVESKRTVKQPEPVADLTDFMNDMFFGTVKKEKKVYNLSGVEPVGVTNNDDQDDDFDSSTRSNSSRLTQEWLDEAKRLVASSPARTHHDSPARFAGSPRFATASPKISTSATERRDPLSRSARRHRAVEGFSGEILTKSAQHTHSRNNSLNRESSTNYPNLHDLSSPSVVDISPAASVQKWISTLLKPDASDLSNPPPPSSETPNSPRDIIPSHLSTNRRSRFDNNLSQPSAPPLPDSLADPNDIVAPRLSVRKTRFQNDPNAAASQPQVVSTKRTFNSPADKSTTTSSFPEDRHEVLSPPRNLVESAQRRSISSSTCSTDRVRGSKGVDETDLNGFLKQQRIKMVRLANGEIKGKANIVLSGPSNSTSSMVAAICYAWLLDKRTRRSSDGVKGGGNEMMVVAPVLNVRRRNMWKQRQAAWLFHHAGVDASALLFSDEVDTETLVLNQKFNVLVVGQEILRTSGEDGSKCTILTDNFCEEAYDLLQIPVLKKLLLAGILLDTHNLDASLTLSVTRDIEAVQLLSVGSDPDYGCFLYDQLTEEQRDGAFFEALRRNYGKPPNEGSIASRSPDEEKKQAPREAVERKSDRGSKPVKRVGNETVPSKPVPKKATTPATAPPPDANRGKNTFFLAKWFGFGR